MQKDLIKTRFKKSLKTYNDNAIVQKQMAKTLAEIAGKGSYDTVLELGCGTGFLTGEILKNINFSKYYAVDFVEGCKDYISDISKAVQFICDDLEKIDISKYKPNLVVSNAAIQWADNLPDFIDNVVTQTEPNGTFAFSVFGQDNFKELEKVLPQNTSDKMKYYSIEELEDILKKYPKKIIKEETITLKFNSPKDVLHHIKNTGVNGVKRVIWTKKDLISFEKKYTEIYGQNIILTYHPIYVKIEK